MATTAYEDVLHAVERLTPEEQAQLVTAIEELAERRAMDNDAQWSDVSARLYDQQQKLVEKIRADIQAGRTKPLDPERL
jgi:hypothetical protein